MIESVGFKYVGDSDAAIGESDRMTLKFIEAR
jgi:hypothetical protein